MRAGGGAGDRVEVAMGSLMRRGAVAAGAAVVLLSPAVGGAPLAAAAQAVSGGTRGTAALNTGGAAQVYSVSCAAAGSCGAGGYYTDGSGHGQAFVASQVNGSWGAAIEVPGTA